MTGWTRVSSNLIIGNHSPSNHPLFPDNSIYNGLLRVMEFGQSENFSVPVDLNVHPIYGMIIAYLMDLSTIKARLENHFYRREEAVLFDVAAI